MEISNQEINQENIDSSIANHSINKSDLTYIIAISIIALLTLIGILLFSLLIHKSKPKRYSLPRTEIKSNNLTNTIKAKYEINSSNDSTTIFHYTYMDLIDGIEINGERVEKNNTPIFENDGIQTVEFHFKSDLTSLDNLFFKVNTLQEVDLSNITSTKIKSASDLFNGCSNLKKVNFSKDYSNLNNISNMFSGCSSLESINMNAFNKDTLQDISGLFS